MNQSILLQTLHKVCQRVALPSAFSEDGDVFVGIRRMCSTPDVLLLGITQSVAQPRCKPRRETLVDLRGSKQAWRPAALSSAGTPPTQVGRPMDLHCRPRFDENGNKVTWSGDGIPNELLYGPKGWCEADEPEFRCALRRPHCYAAMFKLSLQRTPSQTPEQKLWSNSFFELSAAISERCLCPEMKALVFVLVLPQRTSAGPWILLLM